jgi:DNA-binding SARP family transcriptional activator/tetratricopeptide (TPR) repeat protein
MAGTFLLKCLGLPELRAPDGKPLRFRVKKHLALLVYLAVERRRSHERDRLVGMLWPRASLKAGRHSLATALSLLRAILGRSAFPSSRPVVRFAPTDLALDLDRLERGAVLGGEGEDPLEVDGFLRGFDLPDAPEFELWKEREHARRLPAIHAGLLTLIDHGRRRGSHAEVMGRAERLLALDHLAEEGVRAKIEALALAGDRFSALRVFDEWKEQLARELAAEPSSLLEGMAAQLRKRGWEPREPAAMPAVPAEQWRDRRFVGRAAEFRTLYDAWETTHQYRPRHVYLVGDSGVGKTTLAQRLVTAAGLEGASVSRVQCFHLEQKLPYATIGGLVAGLLGRPGVSATAPEALAEIARIVPQIKDHFPSLPPPKPSEGETARLLFAEGVMDLFSAVMDERPLLLVLDDHHLADEASLAVLHLILRRLQNGRYMVVLIARRADEGESAQARRIREGMARLSIEPLALEPMPEEETVELLRAILEDSPIKPRLPERRALVRASRGFPMALELLTQDWQVAGPASLALSLEAMTADVGGDGGQRHDAYSQLIERILLTLSHSARQVLTLAALLGSRMSDLSLYGLVDLSFGQTVDGISELTAKRILRSIGSALEFINELVRAQVYRQIAGPVRVALHAAIADRLLAAEDAGQLVPGLEIAWHLMRSRRLVEATPRLFRGASEAKDRGAPDEAVLALESALPQLDAESQTRARVVLADLHQELGRWQESLQVLEEARPVLPSLENMARVLEIHARWNLGELDTKQQRDIVDRLVPIATQLDVAAGKAYLLVARLARDTAEVPLMRDLLAVHPNEPSPEASDALLFAVGKALLHYHLRDRERSLEIARIAHAKILQTNRGDAAAVRLMMGLAVLSASIGDYEESIRIAQQALVRGRRLDNDTLVGQIESNTAVSHLRLRRYEEAVALARSARSHLPTVRSSNFLMKAIQIDGLGNALLGDVNQAMGCLAEGDRKIASVAESVFAQDWLLSRADILWKCGRRAAALHTASEATTGSYGRAGDIGFAGQHARWVGRVAIERGHPDVALATLAPVVEELPKLDALDKVEVLSTLKRLNELAHGSAPAEILKPYHDAMSHLDSRFAAHLEDLEVL